MDALRMTEKNTDNDYSTLLCTIMVIVIIYLIIRDYLYYKTEDPWMITNIGDLDNLIAQHKYAGSSLCEQYSRLSDADKAFAEDYIAHSMLSHKSVRPSFKKRYGGFVKQIFIASIISFVVFSSSMKKQLKQNTVNYFISNLL